MARNPLRKVATSLTGTVREVSSFLSSFRGLTFPQIVKRLTGTMMGKCIAASVGAHIAFVLVFSIGSIRRMGTLKEQKPEEVIVDESKIAGKVQKEKGRTEREIKLEEQKKLDEELAEKIEEEDQKEAKKIKAVDDKKSLLEELEGDLGGGDEILEELQKTGEEEPARE